MIQLRPDQVELKSNIYNALGKPGVRDVCAVAVTGFGKSVTMTDITLDYHNARMTNLTVAHRNELVGQMSGHIARRGIPHRVIAPKPIISSIINKHRAEFGRSFVNPDSITAVAGIDTLLSRGDKMTDFLTQCRLYQTDEGHHQLVANKWGKGRLLAINAVGIGWTGSPSRADGMGLGRHHDGLYDAMILSPGLREVINAGNLCDYQLALPESDLVVTDDDITPTGDFSPSKLKKAAQKSRIVGDVVREYVKHALGKQAICFATDVETARKIADNFNAVGIPAASVDGTSDPTYRTEMVQRFGDGRLRVLINVDLFDEGFDVPACEVVIMARPTASLVKYLQMFGRALRTAPGKLYGLIIDHVGNWKRHGPPDKQHFWTLDRRDKRGKATADPELIPESACTSCSRSFPRISRECPWCGADRPLPAPADRTPEMVDGDLILLDPATLAQMRGDTVLDTPADVANRVAGAAGQFAGRGAANKQMEKIQAQERLKLAFAQWAAVERLKGRADPECHRRIYHALGMDMLSALSKDRSTADYNSTAAIVEGWVIT